MLAFLLVAGLINWMATFIIVEGKIFQPVRDRAHGEYLRYLVACHLCAGVWVGFVEAAALMALHQPVPYHGAWVLVVANGLAFKAVGHLFLVLHKLGDATVDRIREDRTLVPVKVPGLNGTQERVTTR